MRTGKMPNPSSRSSTRVFRLAAGLLAGMLCTGCPIVIGVLGGFQLIKRSEIKVTGTITPNGNQKIKVGTIRYFEGDDATGTYRIIPGNLVTFTKFEVPPVGVPKAGSTESATTNFTIALKSDHKVAQFVVVAWADTISDNNLSLGEEVQAVENYQVLKMNETFTGTCARDGTFPLATTSVVTFSDASTVKFNFTFPEPKEEPRPAP